MNEHSKDRLARTGKIFLDITIGNNFTILEPLRRKSNKKSKQLPAPDPAENKKVKSSTSNQAGASLGSADAFMETENLRDEGDRDWSDRELDERLGDDHAGY